METFKKYRFLLLIPCIWLISWLLFQNNTILHFWKDEIAHHYTKWLGQISSKLFFSIGDLFYGVLAMIFGYSIYFIIRNLRKRVILLPFLKRLNIFIACFYVYFLLVWGGNYYLPNYNKYDESNEIQTEEVKALAQYFLEKSNRYAHQSNGQTIWNEEVFTEIKKELGGNLKPSMYSFILPYLGVSGYYNPFTAEAHYGDAQPHIRIPFTMAHERSHQWGVAKEGEASFEGFLWAKRMKNRQLMQSIYYQSMRACLNALPPEDSTFIEETKSKFNPELRKIYVADSTFRAEHRGVIKSGFRGLNHLFLKANQQDGIQSYGYYVSHLVAYYRKNSPKAYQP